MIPERRAVDVTSITPALGVRFFDLLTEAFVADGLTVSAYPIGCPALRRYSSRTPSGVHAFHDLPGLRGLQYARFEPALAASAPRLDFRVEVDDEQRRFLPFSFEAALPNFGIFQLDCAAGGGSWSGFSAPDSIPGIPLYSAPTRAPERTFGCVRADLWDPVRKRPAAWVLVEARPGTGPAARGFSDERGQLAIFLPYPEPSELPSSTSSAFPSSPPLGEQTWPVELTAFYTPEATTVRSFDLCSKLAQSSATLWADSTRLVPLAASELQFGRELIVRTQGATDPSSKLWVTSA